MPAGIIKSIVRQGQGQSQELMVAEQTMIALAALERAVDKDRGFHLVKLARTSGRRNTSSVHMPIGRPSKIDGV